MSTAASYSGGLSETEHDRHLRRALIASTVGTTIEWYDFLLYGTVTGLVFGKLFFPGSDALTGVLQAFGVFFIGFVGRPIGAAIFGHWGDRIGRKATLIATLLLTGIATTLVGLVPTLLGVANSGQAAPGLMPAGAPPLAILHVFRAPVGGLFRHVVDLVRGENAMLAALLSDARPVAVHDRELTLAFPGGAAFLGPFGAFIRSMVRQPFPVVHGARPYCARYAARSASASTSW